MLHSNDFLSGPHSVRSDQSSPAPVFSVEFTMSTITYTDNSQNHMDTNTLQEADNSHNLTDTNSLEEITHM